MAILGIDEVGRGPLAGPLVVGAVILPEDEDGQKPDWVDALRDSKKLSPKKRKELAETIYDSEGVAVGLGWVSAGEIDRMGMMEALRLATRRAVKKVQSLHVPFSQIIIDGNINFLENTALERYTSTIIKGDDLIKEISAVSIVAKVARDEYMMKIATEYPGYGFEKHMGYGTSVHRNSISELGLCPEHRRLVRLVRDIAERDGEDLSNVWGESQHKNTTSLGLCGEDAACRYLEGLGHTVLMRNFRTKVCEIDIISMHEGKMYFTEVKYRKNDSYGGGMAAIDGRKLKQMKFAVECFSKFRPDLARRYDLLLAAADVTGEDYLVKEWVVISQ